MSLSIIVAVAQNGAIGKNNKLLWHISNDLKRFKEITLDKKIIMGRKTFESLPGVLQRRKHIVITRDKNFFVDNENATVENSLLEVLEKYKGLEEEVFIIGGKEIYEQAFPFCNKIYLTKVFKDFDADVYLNLDLSSFMVESESEIFQDEKTGLNFKYIDLEK